MTFAAQLKAARAAKGLSQSQAAELLQRSVRTLQDWEVARHTPHPDVQEIVLHKIAKSKPSH